jgi:hypothetical protein
MKTLITPAERFAPARSLFFPLTFFALSFTGILLMQLFREPNTIDRLDLLTIGTWLVALGLHLWQWNGTYYELKDCHLHYRCGFTKGSLPVESIRKVETNTRAWGNVQAALAFKGMMITYNKWDEVFIAPKDETAFLKKLLELNPGIEVKKPQDQPAASGTKG